MSVEKKVALVTGSASGIGLACAHALAKHGINMIITGSRDATLVSGILDDIKRYNVKVDYVRADLGKKTDIESLWAEVTRLYPDGIDILVNNAGCDPNCPTECLSDDAWDRTIAVNLSAPFHLTKRCLPAMKKKGWGRIVNMSSVNGLVGSTDESVYTASKHGLCGLTKAVALENAACGITCNAVCPGYIDTPLLLQYFSELKNDQGLSPEEHVAQVVEAAVPTKTLISPQQVAELVEFLCTSNASSQMTGGSYLIDGGYTAL